MSSPRQATPPKHTPPLPRRLTSTSARATCQEPGSHSDTLPNPHPPEGMPLMPFPYVDSATIKNDSIELAVEVDPNDSGTYVEVSGSATQTGGAFANFYDIRPVPAAPNDPDDPTSTKRYVFVSAHAIPPNKFREDQDVTVVIDGGNDPARCPHCDARRRSGDCREVSS